jgi:hypothetical protein
MAMNTELRPEERGREPKSPWRTIIWSAAIMVGFPLFIIGVTFIIVFIPRYYVDLDVVIQFVPILVLMLVFSAWFVFIYRSLMARRIVRAMIALLPFVLLLAVIVAIAIPSFFKARNISQQNACIGNLRIIDAGKEQWAMANKLTDGTPVVTASVNEYVKGNTTPICPAGGTYTYCNIGSNPRCNIKTPTSHIFGGGNCGN